MKPCEFHTQIIILLGIISLWVCPAGIGHASDIHEQSQSQGGASKTLAQAMMAKWQEYATPSENHKILSPLVGTWKQVVKWWMKPGIEPEISNGTSVTTWVMGGRYLQHTVKGISKGEPFEGLGFTGFDNKKKKYQTIWMDNMGTGMMIGEGTYDLHRKTLNDRGFFTDAVMGQRAYRGVITFVDDTHHSYEMYGVGQTGLEFRMLEIMYTRID